MTDCPRCQSRMCVDDVGYCTACGKVVRVGLSGLALTKGAARIRPEPKEPESPARG
jgi:hypothetical protein